MPQFLQQLFSCNSCIVVYCRSSNPASLLSTILDFIQETSGDEVSVLLGGVGRGAPIEDFTDIPITDILSRIKADTDNR